MNGWSSFWGMDTSSQVELWAMREFGDVELGDVRRSARLVDVAAGLASKPGRAISTCCGTSGAQAISRLFAREEVTVESTLTAHIQQTRHRCEGHKRVVGVQDTTVLDFTAHKSKRGIGSITTAENSRGLLMHSVLMVSEHRTPLGLAGTQIWARNDEDRGCAKERRDRPIWEKESNRWLVGLSQAQEAAPGDCELVVTGDRESDIYELFIAPRDDRTHLLVRVAQDRAIEDSEHKHLKEAAACAPVVGAYKVDVLRKPGVAKREAWLEIRVTAVTVRPPSHLSASQRDEGGVKVWLVRASEREVPEGVEGIDWLLVTTEDVEGLEQAVRAVQEYSCRWVIEEFHRVLKSGCRVERMQFEDAESLAPAIAVNAVVSWRILYMTKLSREEPDCPASVVASQEEVNVLELWLEAHRQKMRRVMAIRDFVRAVALLGGFMGRKSDGEPGTKVLWQGLKRLEDLLIGYRLAAGQEIR